MIYGLVYGKVTKDDVVENLMSRELDSFLLHKFNTKNKTHNNFLIKGITQNLNEKTNSFLYLFAIFLI